MSTNSISQPSTGRSGEKINNFLDHIIQTAELKYGQRDITYLITGVEFENSGYPYIWYPANSKDVTIRVTINCLDDINRTVFQVAHEVIHCLSPTGSANANFLEEGLATHFSIEYTKNNGFGPWSPGNTKYEEALGLVKELFSFDSDIVKKLRKTEPTLSLITKDLIIATNSNIPENLAENLEKKF